MPASDMQALNIQAFKITHLKTLLAPLAVALVLAAPCAFAKKDLFANDPGSKQNYQTEQLAPTLSVSNSSNSSISLKESVREEVLAETIKNEEKAKNPVAQAKSTTEAEQEKKSSYLETQFSRFKGHLVEAKEDLFGSKKKSAQKEALTVPQQTETTQTDSTHSNGEARSSEEAKPEIPTISSAEAAQRAQTMAEGQVINVRKYQEDDKPRYAVKLLQKNGRMKTINIDAVNGSLIEEPQ